jgi:hypothetical protein
LVFEAPGRARNAPGMRPADRTTVSRNRTCQPRKPATRPPKTGPIAAPAPTLAESRPSAVPRYPGGSDFATAAKPRAGMAEAPIPCTIRPATSKGRVGASAQNREPTARTARPTANVRRRL